MFFLATLLNVASTFASPNPDPRFPVFDPISGVADGTGKLDKAAIKAAADELRAYGAKPIAFAYNNSYGIDPIQYEKLALETYGFGNPDKKNLNGDIVMIAINYADRTIRIHYGDRWEKTLKSTINPLIDAKIKPFALNEPTKAFASGFLAVKDEIDPPWWRFTRAYGPPFAIFCLAAFLLWLSYVQGIVLIRLMKMRSALVAVRNRVENRYFDNDKMADHPDGAMVNVVAMILTWTRPSYPDQAEQLEGDFAQAQARVKEHLGKSDLALAQKFWLFTSVTQMNEMIDDFSELREQFQPLINWAESTRARYKVIKEKINSVTLKLGQITESISAREDWYAKVTAGSKLLPKMEDAFFQLLAALAEADKLINTDQQSLKGADLLDLLSVQLQDFEKAVGALQAAEAQGIGAQGTIHQSIQRWSTEVPNAAAICATAWAVVNRALSEMTNDRDYTDAKLSAEQASGLFEQALVASQALVAALAKRDQCNLELKAIFGSGYRNQVVAILEEATRHTNSCYTSLTGGDYNEGARFANLMAETMSLALTTMQELVLLHLRNTRMLGELSDRVAKNESRRTGVVSTKWLQLQREFTKPNWASIASFFDRVTELVNQVFDNPSDPKDMASMAGTENSMDNQNFKGAEAIIADMLKLIAEAERLMDSIESHHTLVLQARDTHVAAITRGQERLETAKAIHDQHDGWIDESVDTALSRAQEALTKARRHAADKFFVAALEQAQLCQKLAESARSSSEQQISAVSTAFSMVEGAKTQSSIALARAKADIEHEDAAVTQSGTTTALRTALNAWNAATKAESAAASKEDHQLLRSLQEAANSYSQALSSAQAASRSLRDDQSSYAELMRSAQSAINDAERAINNASGYCSDSRAGYAGDSALSSARNMVPDEPRRGMTRQQLQRIVDEADRAERQANSAASAARNAIQEYEDEERRKRDAEVARQAAESARQAAASTSSISSYTSSNTSNTGGFGQGGMSDTHHF